MRVEPCLDVLSPPPRPLSVRRRLQAAGIVYLGVTLGLNIYYMKFVVERSVSNDYYWPGFNSTGIHTFLGDIFNSKLPLVEAAAMVVPFNPSLTMFKSYADADTVIDTSPSAARAAMLMFDTTIAISPYC
ncbi:Aste57867_10579 [Aphanomyces stellatus]|uniref:Aste57867_10579 protein n=1 Tax=Aphanomyces stellatus TaxID=120398 RepID=A0A485KQS7_9STRA|nr:hypothetical protein As57867_010539 [Aphanomyces stellatus]VFT87452.1 Aste57867_10579 [Aphanomyces stellatus]